MPDTADVVTEWVPLSPVQEGLWFLQRLTPLSAAYHLARAFHLHGPLHERALVEALAYVSDKQAVFRTRFAQRDGKALQRVVPSAGFAVQKDDISALEADARETALHQILATDATQPFDLASQGAVRFRLVKLSADRHVLMVVVHHLISDGVSTALFTRELTHAYQRLLVAYTEAHPATQQREPLQGASASSEQCDGTWTYTDFSAWQRATLSSEAGQADLAWWVSQLASTEEDALNGSAGSVSGSSGGFPLDFAREAASGHPAATHRFTLSPATVETLRACCRAQRCTPFVGLMAAWQILLSRYSGRNDFCIGVPTSGRSLTETENLIGLFVDTRVHRARIHPAMTGRGIMQTVRAQTRAALDHPHVTLPALIDALGVRADALFDTLFNVQNAVAVEPLLLQDLTVQIEDFESPVARFDMSVDLRISPETVNGTLRYDSALYKADTVAKLARQYEAVIVALCTSPDVPIGAIEFVDEADRAKIDAWCTHTEDYGPSDPVHRLFERHAEATPHATALLCGDAALTYRELNVRANQLAHRLRRLGVAPEVLVGVQMHRSVDLIVSLLAILKAGGAYVPIDPDYPVERRTYMVEDSGISLLLTHREAMSSDVQTSNAQHACAIASVDDWDLSDEPTYSPEVATHAENLVYVIYTSGSTGRPKGAANRHGGLFNRLAWMQEAYALKPADTVLQKTPFSFDVSVWECFWPLTTGARLAMAAPGDHRDPARLLALIEQYRVTTLHFVPSMLQAFVTFLTTQPQSSSRFNSLRQIVCSGEALPSGLQDRALDSLKKHDASPAIKLHNLYGPTEAAIDVTHWTCRKGDAVVPIGRPIANVSTYVLNGAMQQLPVGVQGELYLGGAGLARGYLNRAALTAERFVPDPFVLGGRLYQTGDAVRWRDDGALDYLGRLDHQIKIRGFRIELGEIESALQTLPGVAEAVVSAQDGPNGKRLVAYVTALPAHVLKHEALAAALASLLPDYMVPAAWVDLDQMPLSPNGKVDRRALPAPSQIARAWRAPEGEVETVVASVWQHVLGGERIGRDDNFFELGGDSILSLQIVDRLRQAGWKVTPRQLFERQSVSALASVAEPAQDSATVVSATSDGFTLTPMHRWFLAQALPRPQHWNQAVLLTTRTPLNPRILSHALHRLVAYHEALRLRLTRRDGLPCLLPAANAQNGEVLDGDGKSIQEDGASEPEMDTARALLWLRNASSVAQIPSLCDEAQRSLDLEQGPLLRAMVITLPEAQDAPDQAIQGGAETSTRTNTNTNTHISTQSTRNCPDERWRLLLVIHHLAVDGVSWRILLRQLQTDYDQLSAAVDNAAFADSDSGQASRPPLLSPPDVPRTTSVGAWAMKLAAYAKAPQTVAQLPYWQAILRAPATLPADFPEGANTAMHRQALALTLDKSLTKQLLQDATLAYRTQVNDLLLSAVGRVLCDWTGSACMRIDLEGHGREDRFDDMDVSQTVGWFTSLYPVRLDPQGEWRAALKRVKEDLRRVPDRGLGFAALKFLGEDATKQALDTEATSDVVFNYLGQFDQHFAPDSAWRPAHEVPGSSQDDHTPLAYALSISGKVLEGALTLTFSYSSARYRERTIAGLIDKVRDSLASMVAHCIDATPSATPSDFPLVSLGQTELDSLPLHYADVADMYPLSPMQSGMLFHSLYRPEGTAYINQLSVDLDNLDAPRFAAAWAAAARRHDILRTRFVPQGEGWLQWVARAAPAAVTQQDWRGQGNGTNNETQALTEALDQFAVADFHRGFSLTEAPLYRLTLIRTGNRRYRFVWTHHHLLLDGWSVSQLLAEVLREYNGERLPAHGGRYRDYIAWLQARSVAAGEVHWREQLGRLTEPTHLAAAFAHGNRADPEGTHPDRAGYGLYTVEYNAQTTARLMAFARTQHVTMNTLIQAAWALLLQRYTQQETVVFGATLSGRPDDLPGAGQLLGLFINTLPVITQPRGDVHLDAWLGKLQDQGLAAQEHAHTPLHDIQRWAGESGRGLFDTVVVFENYPVDAVLKAAAGAAEHSDSVASDDLIIADVHARDESSYALTLGITEAKTGGDKSDANPAVTLKMGYRFSRALFTDENIAAIAAHMGSAMRSLDGAGERCLDTFDLLEQDERAALLTQAGETVGLAQNAAERAIQPFTDPRQTIACVHTLIADRATTQCNALAVIAGETVLRYGDLDTRANRLAHRLQQQGVGPEMRVGLAVNRSVDMIIAMLAVLKAGGAYVPLDPAYPIERLRYMIADSAMGMVLTDCALHVGAPKASIAQAWRADVTVLSLDTLDVSMEPAWPPQCSVLPENLAYVIYTSGSTGQPKGVAVQHGALSMHCQAIARYHDMQPADRELHLASINFDIAHERWIVPLLAGAAVVLGDGAQWSSTRLVDEMRRRDVSVVFMTPSYLTNHLSDAAWDAGLSALRLCIVGGEAWAADAVKTAARKLGNCRLISAYGPTETVIAPTAWEVDLRAMSGRYAPIGKPVGERTAYVLDDDMHLVPSGVPGELYLGGAGLARGYVGRAAMTAHRFVPDPFARDGGRLYRTGDRVRWRADGQLEYLERLDDQVKIRGFRIELGDVEAALLACAGVRGAVVVVRDDAPSARKMLVGYISVHSGAALEVQGIRAWLAERLPEYMVPSAIVLLEGFPLTPNGKVDRHALPIPAVQTADAYETPEGEIETTIAAIWREVLHIEQVGRHDDFFALGGDSILSLQVQRRVARRLSVEVALATVFSARTLATFAQAVAKARGDSVDAQPADLPIAQTAKAELADAMQAILSEMGE